MRKKEQKELNISIMLLCYTSSELTTKYATAIQIEQKHSYTLLRKHTLSSITQSNLIYLESK